MKLQFVLGSGLSSRLIAWYGQGYGGWSHVDAILSDGSLLGARSDKVGGQPAGVHVRPPGYERWVRTQVVDIPSTPTEDFLWERWLRTQIGAPYDQQAIISFALGRRSHGEGRWICSALQTGALYQVRKLHGLPVPDSQVTPDALFLIVTAGLGGALE